MNEKPISKPAAAWMRDALRQGFAHLAAGQIDEASACCKRLLGANGCSFHACRSTRSCRRALARAIEHNDSEANECLPLPLVAA